MTESGARSGERLLDLVAVMDRLRSPGGCPWDARQTHESLVEYLVEESYEAVEAIETADTEGLKEELGDLLLQVVFHARIAAENEPGWDIDDVAEGIVTKLLARHPHVFGDGDVSASTPEEVEANWHAQKSREKGRESVTEGIPNSLPALVLAGKVLARSAGLSTVTPPLAESAVATQILTNMGSPERLGDLLLAIVAEARERGIDSESALRGAVRRRVADVRQVEGLE